MITLPATLEKRLKKLISRGPDRQKFLKDVVTKAIDELEASEGLPGSIGGTLHLYTDGGARGNPGEAAIGCVLIDPDTGKHLELHKEAIGIQTNNVAEYRALIEGLKIAQKHHPNRLVCFLDSELIVKQMSGEYRVKMPSLQPLFEEIQSLITAFADVSFSHIPRHQNAQADRLVNEALDGK